MKIHFFGCRAVIPVPGSDTVRFGGNTHCLVIESNNGQRLIVNAGSGLRLANSLFNSSSSYSDQPIFEGEINLLLSQHHWDHIQGFPLFEPIHKKNKSIVVYTPDQDEHHDTAILDQINKSFSVEKFHQLAANITIKRTKFDSPTPVEIGEFGVQGMRVNHPHGGTAYKIECEGKTIVIAHNNELFAPQSHCYHTFEEWALFCSGADLLLHDARFMNNEMINRVGVGHSCMNDVIQLAKTANVKLVGFTCHDPSTTDERLESLTNMVFEQRPPFSFFFAKEGRTIIL